MSLAQKLRKLHKQNIAGWELIEPAMKEFEAKMRAAESMQHPTNIGNRANWEIIRINHQRSRYIYQLYYQCETISKELYDFCIKERIVDAQLIAKWKNSEHSNLCCLGCIQISNTNFGTTCICRVPKSQLNTTRTVECFHCGCRGCGG